MMMMTLDRKTGCESGIEGEVPTGSHWLGQVCNRRDREWVGRVEVDWAWIAGFGGQVGVDYEGSESLTFPFRNQIGYEEGCQIDLLVLIDI